MSSAPDGTLGSASATADIWVIEPRQHGALDRIRELWRTVISGGTSLANDHIPVQAKQTRLAVAAVAGGGPGGAQCHHLRRRARQSPQGDLCRTSCSSCAARRRGCCSSARCSLSRAAWKRTGGSSPRVYFPRLILPVAAVAPGLVYLVDPARGAGRHGLFFHQRDGMWYVLAAPSCWCRSRRSSSACCSPSRSACGRRCFRPVIVTSATRSAT